MQLLAMPEICSHDVASTKSALLRPAADGVQSPIYDSDLHWQSTHLVHLLQYAAALQPERRAAAPEAAAAIDTFLDKLTACTSGQQAFTVELDDPAGNSYIESPAGDVNADNALTVSFAYHLQEGQLLRRPEGQNRLHEAALQECQQSQARMQGLGQTLVCLLTIKQRPSAALHTCHVPPLPSLRVQE